MARHGNVTVDGNTTTMNLTIEADACDMMGTWRPSAALAVMQQATFCEQEALGISWSELSERGALWVVSRINLAFSRVPKYGEELTVQAIALPAVKLLFPWKFRFIDSAGETIGEGSTLWNLMDAATRRISFVPGIGDKIPKLEGAARPELPKAAEELSCMPQRNAMRPVYTDLDINGHVSHIRYIDWCCNALGADTLHNFEVKSFRISFMQEVPPETIVDTELRMNGSEFSFSGYVADSPAFIVNGTLSKR